MNLAYRKSFYVFHDEANLDQRNSTKDKALSPTLGHLAILEGFIDQLLLSNYCKLRLVLAFGQNKVNCFPYCHICFK